MEQEIVGYLTDPVLNDVVQQLKREFPSMGETMLWGAIANNGIQGHPQ